MGSSKTENAENKNEEVSQRYWRRPDGKILKVTISTEETSWANSQDRYACCVS